MAIFVHIITSIILPIFIIILAGYLLQKKFNLDVRTFTRLNMYIFVPAVLFTKVYNTNATLQFFGTILLYIVY